MTERILSQAERVDLARIVVAALDQAEDPDALVRDIATKLAADDPGFDADGFVAACRKFDIEG